jgi:hypothetical protein
MCHEPVLFWQACDELITSIDISGLVHVVGGNYELASRFTLVVAQQMACIANHVEKVSGLVGAGILHSILGRSGPLIEQLDHLKGKILSCTKLEEITTFTKSCCSEGKRKKLARTLAAEAEAQAQALPAT